VIAHTIGVGIFLTPAELIGALASPGATLTVWVVCGTLVLGGALVFGELASRYPEAGGIYVYLREAWGERIAFLYGWQCLLVMDPGVTAALAAGLAEYLAVLHPGAANPRAWSIVIVWVLASVGMVGLRATTRVLGALTALKMAVLAGVVLAAFAIGEGSWSHLVPFATRRASAVSFGEALALGLVGAFFSFGGFWEASRVAGEVREPSRTLPRAFAYGVGAVTLIYVLTTVAFMYLVPVEASGSASAFAQRAGVAIFGPSGPRVLALIVILSVVASLLALLMMAPRLYVAMGRDGLLPRWPAAVHPTRGTPARGTALLAALATLFVSIGRFQQIVAFFLVPALVFVALASAALFIVRRRDPTTGGYVTALYPLTPALFVALLGTVVALVCAARPREAFAGVSLVLLGVPAHAWLRRTRHQRREIPDPET
jgi:APA family basic amino acid/polyamine antiporter